MTSVTVQPRLQPIFIEWSFAGHPTIKKLSITKTCSHDLSFSPQSRLCNIDAGRHSCSWCVHFAVVHVAARVILERAGAALLCGSCWGFIPKSFSVYADQRMMMMMMMMMIMIMI